MTTQQRDAIDQILRNAPFDLGGDVATQRPLLDQMLTSQPLPADVRTTPGALGGIPVIFSEIADVEPRGTILHIHGGGFALGSAEGSVGLASDLARRTGMRAISVDYRLAPEHPYPAALEDITAAYRALVEQAGSADHIVVSGESAGGNLAIEFLIAGKARGLTMPAATLLLSPMTDLTVTGSSYASKAHADPGISAQAIRTRSADYLGGTDPADPLVSPIFADLSGLPPLLIQAGSHEVLLDDATRLAVKAAADDVAVILDITPGVPHVFQAFAAILEEGDAALNRAARFVKDNTTQKATSLGDQSPGDSQGQGTQMQRHGRRHRPSGGDRTAGFQEFASWRRPVPPTKSVWGGARPWFIQRLRMRGARGLNRVERE
jgi:acetyl esterase/lipase